MYPFGSLYIFTLLFLNSHAQFVVYETDINFRVEPGSRMCFYEKGAAGQSLELYYQVLDGQHGDLDITFTVVDPKGTKLVDDLKKPQNSVIMDLATTGDHEFCMDNTYSRLNSKLVFVYVLIENKTTEFLTSEAEVSVVNENGEEQVEEAILEWAGVDENGQEYYLEVRDIADALTRTLRHVVKAKHLLDVYGASKSRDSYLAYEDTFIVDVWSSFQISFMCAIGMLQVYMIKKLFDNPYKRGLF